jgi:hypothetical protein
LLLVLGVAAWGCGGGGGGGTGGGGGGLCADPYAGFPSSGTGTLIRGRVLNNPGIGVSDVAIANVRLRFETTAGALIQEVTTNSCGAYQVDSGSGAVPTRIRVVSSSIPSNYHPVYTYSGVNYSAILSKCLAILPSFGSPLNLNSPIRLNSISVVSPIPDGCLALCTDPYASFPATGTGKLIRGRVVTIPSTGGANIPVENVTLRLETTGGTVLNTVSTDSCGAYQIDTGSGPVPTRLNVVNSSIPSTFYSVYFFNGKNYAANLSNCAALLPTFPSTVNVAPATVLLSRTGPPPVPDGCLAP